MNSIKVVEIIRNIGNFDVRARAKRTPNGKTIPTHYEDMYPFLNKSEINEASYDSYVYSMSGKDK